MRRIRETSVCVVGGAGFLGSHLVDHLIEDRACDVLVVDNLCVGRREFVHPKAKFVHHDITGSEEFMVKLFLQQNIKYVFNYAAWPYVPDSFDRPLHVFNVNAMGAIKVINAAQEACCNGVLQVSSAELYGGHYVREGPEGKVFSIDEVSPVSPHSTYGAAKAAVDYYCQVAWRERKTKVIALRQFNCLGERETHPYVVPEIISQLHKGNRVGMYYQVELGNNSTRDFMYAGDAVSYAVELLECGQWGEVYNLGSEGCTAIYDLAVLIGELMGRQCAVKHEPNRDRPWEIWSLTSDNSKIHDTVKYRPSTSLEEALGRTIRYFHNNGNRWDWEPPHDNREQVTQEEAVV
jgi:nucleoside-diphosphate-sugar epimerase